MADVIIFEDANFGGTGIMLGVGNYRLFNAADMNDLVSSIQVPQGLVAMVYEHADASGGYGVSADFLEDCSDLAPLGLNDKISYVSVFEAELPSGIVWRRGSLEDGQYVPGHWERKRVVEPPPNHVVVVSPPIPPRTTTMVVYATGPQASAARSLFQLLLNGPDDPRLQRATGRLDESLRCTFPYLPPGRYWLTADTKADLGWGASPSRTEVLCQVDHSAQVFVRFG